MRLTKAGVVVACIIGTHFAAAILLCHVYGVTDGAKLWQKSLVTVMSLGILIGVGVVGMTTSLYAFNLLTKGGWMRGRIVGLFPIPARIVGAILIVLGPAIVASPLLYFMETSTEFQNPPVSSGIVIYTMPFPAAFIAALFKRGPLVRVGSQPGRFLKSFRDILVRP